MNRLWIGRAQYPGRRPFIFGNVVLPTDAKHHEIAAALADLWASLSPHPAPPFVPEAGAVFYRPEESE